MFILSIVAISLGHSGLIANEERLLDPEKIAFSEKILDELRNGEPLKSNALAISLLKNNLEIERAAISYGDILHSAIFWAGLVLLILLTLQIIILFCILNMRNKT